jgi:hypothetical protein
MDRSTTESRRIENVTGRYCPKERSHSPPPPLKKQIPFT